jgi:hypothetical protein
MKRKTMFVAVGMLLAALILVAGIGIANAETSCFYGCNGNVRNTHDVVADKPIQVNYGSVTPAKTIVGCSITATSDTDNHTMNVEAFGATCGTDIPVMVCLSAPKGFTTINMTDVNGFVNPLVGFRNGKLLCVNTWLPVGPVGFGLAKP